MILQFISRYRHNLFFIALLLLISFHYGFHKILPLKPMGSHVWRQTDCASLAYNYYQNGMNLFKPQVHNYLGDNGYGISEFPLIYYSVAALYQVFGPKEIIFRIVNMLILFAGIFSLFKLTSLFFKDVFWGYFLGIFIFTSPVLLYYGTNFLSDAPGFCFALIGLWQFFRFYESGRLSTFYLALFFLLIGSLLKITAAMSLIAITGIYFLELINWFRFGPDKRKLFGHIKAKAFAGFAVVYGLLLCWYMWAIYYNKKHDTDYFSTRTWPIWDLEPEHIDFIWTRLLDFWMQFYFHKSTQIIIVALTVILLVYQAVLLFKKAMHPLPATFMVILLAGVISYSMLWFFAYQDHDYYFVNTLIYVVFLFISLIWILKFHLPKIYTSTIFRVILVGFLVVNIQHAHKRIKRKYEMFAHENAHPALYKEEFKLYLRSLGINRKDKVISLPDPTPNMTLYLMNQPGWSELYCKPIKQECIVRYLEKGAKYLILSDQGFANQEAIAPYATHKIGEFEGVAIYKLPKP